MKQLRISLLPLLIASGFFLDGCASVAPGNDPVVVNAERTIAIGTDAFDTFLLSEEQTRASLCAVSPTGCREVHSYAEFLRTKVNYTDPATGSPAIERRSKMWLITALNLTETYKTSRTPENKANLTTILNTITKAVAESQKYLTKLRAVKGP